jgi:hypothetical protein
MSVCWAMSGLLKKLLFGIWGLLLIPLIVPNLKKWLEENVFRSPRHGDGGFSRRNRHPHLQQAPRAGRAALVQVGAGLPDRCRRGRLAGMAESKVGREESRRASQPRLEVPLSVGEHQDSDGLPVAGMARQCARSQACNTGCSERRQETGRVGAKRSRVPAAGRDIPLRILQERRQIPGRRGF